MNIRSIMSMSPYLEVAIRYLYWHSPYLQSKKDKISPKDVSNSKDPSPFGNIIGNLRKRGVGSNDLLVVHSSLADLKSTGVTATTVINELLNLIGVDGTLAMPAMPRYKNEPMGMERLTADISGIVFEYDLKKTLPWTGAIPRALLKYPGAIRSRHPLNSMVAVGPMSGAMMADNLVGDKPLPCGEHSSWKYCADNNAKIVGLGVDLTHSLTMIHVAEDCLVDSWPVRDWWRDRHCVIVDGDERQSVVVRERHPKWALHYAERTLCKDLIREKILTSELVDGIVVEIADAKLLVEYLYSRNKGCYPYYLLKKTK